MTLQELTNKYIQSCEKAMAEVKLAQDIVVLDEDKIKSIVESAKQYLSDAKYYQSQNKLETSLASVAYCEGLLDALRLLGMVEFTWQTKEEKAMKEKKEKVVLASGTFDLLHLGHVKYLEEAKKAGGSNAKLIVIVARDKTVAKRKGRRPVMPEDERKALVESLKVVDKAILGHGDFNISDVIDEIKPDVIAVGHDQANIEEQVRKAVARKGLPIQVVRIGKFGKPEFNSSLKIKRKVTELYKG